MKIEEIMLNETRNVSLTAYLQPDDLEMQETVIRPAILILPGGGYQFCADKEADPVAISYLKAGYHSFILRYSVGHHAEWPHPLEDYEQAMAYIVSQADRWHVAIERIAVIGFSAGGHLAGCAATVSKYRPAAAILGYPVLDGNCVREYLSNAPDVPSLVDEHTCPCFLFGTRTDNYVPIKNAVHMIEALCANEIAFESHIYSNGGHGLSTGDPGVTRQRFCERYPSWVADSISWLADTIGGLDLNGLTSPVFGTQVNGNRQNTLNLDCTVQYLMNHPEGRQTLEELLPNGGKISIPSKAAEVMPLRGMLRFLQLSEESIQMLDERLRKIQNNGNINKKA